MKTFNVLEDAREYSIENPTELIKSKWFNKNGNVEAQLFFLNGLKQGEYKWFYPDGAISECCFYLNGLRHGECEWFNQNGSIAQHGFYLNGNLHGEFKFFNPDGTLHEHCFYLHNKDQPQLDYLLTERDETTLMLLFGDNYL